MTAELAIMDPGQMQAAIDYSERLAYSGLIPDVYQGKPANILWAMEYGRTLGLSTIAAINGVNVIKGKPTASAALISALVRRAGHKMRIGYDAATMTGWAEIVRADDPEFTFRSEWTLERAVEAELCKLKDGKPFAVDSKGNTLPWKKFFPSMVKARATTEVARDACEEVLFGLHYTPEELGAEVDEDGSPIVVRQMPERPAERTRPQQPAEDEWTQPHQTSYPMEIDEAEVVGEEPEPIEDGWTQPLASGAQQKMLHSLITKKLGPQSDADRHGRMSAFTKRTITSASQLTKTEASQIIDALTKRDDFVPPQPEPAPAPVPLKYQQTEDEATIAAAQSLLPFVEADQADALEQRFRDLIESSYDPAALDDALDRVHGAVSDGVLEMDRLKRLMAAGEVKRRDLDAQAAKARQAVAVA